MSGLQEDIAEARSLLEQATRPAVKTALQKLLATLTAQLKKDEAAANAAAAAEARQKAWVSEKTKELEQLEKDKAKAAADEDYEACAKLRDEVGSRSLPAQQATASSRFTVMLLSVDCGSQGAAREPYARHRRGIGPGPRHETTARAWRRVASYGQVCVGASPPDGSAARLAACLLHPALSLTGWWWLWRWWWFDVSPSLPLLLVRVRRTKASTTR